MSSWPEVALTDIYEISSGLSKPADSFGSGFPFLSFKEVFGNYFLPNELGQLVESTDKERQKGSIKRGDVFLTRTSETMHELGMSSVALKDYPDATFNGFSKRLRPKKDSPHEVHPEFIGYCLRSPSFRRGMLAFSTMSTRASLNNDMISRLVIELPPIEIQKEVAKILKALDNKIELNRQTNQTLEHIAQAVFKSWFVDFEPTRAKIAAKQAGQDPERAAMAAISGRAIALNKEQAADTPLETLDSLQQTNPEQYEQLKTTAALFPDALVDSELGEIPEGWSVSDLKSETSKIGSGATPKGGKGAYKIEGISQIRSMNVFDGNFSMKDLAKIDETQAGKLKNVIVEKNDVLLNITGASVTRCCIVPPSVLPARVNQHVCIVRANESSMNPYFVYQTLTSSAGKSLLNSLAQAGATREALTKAHIEGFELIVPDQKLMGEFGSQAANIENMRFRLAENNLELGRVRDTLLPKLLSGELSPLTAEP
ncbi:Type-1 restriction enzyme EcoKI specificity protein [BD1-7 clade bacterium]|nr:Type-1 restriction enzyme EcoKI specificity protein [BD1-7 clade bacterium]